LANPLTIRSIRLVRAPSRRTTLTFGFIVPRK